MENNAKQTKKPNQAAYPTKGSLLLYFVKGSKRFFFGSALFAALTALLELVNPRIIGFTVDSVIGDKAPPFTGMAGAFLERIGGVPFLREHLFGIALAVILIALFGAACRYCFRFLNTLAAENFVKNIRDSVFGHILKLPYAWLVANDTGDLIQRCTSDVETIKLFLSEQLTSLFRVIVLLGLSLRFMWQISPELTVPAAAFIPVIIGYSVFFHTRIRKTFLVADEEEGKLSSIAQENLTGVRVVRAFGREEEERRRFRKQNDIYTDAYMKLSILISAFWSAGDGISGLQVMTVVLLGAVLTVRGGMTAGDYIAFVAYNAMIGWPVRSLGRVIADMSKAGVSIDRIRYIMNAEEEKDREEAFTPPMDQDIVFDHVSFRYAQDAPLILDDVSFRVKAGSTFGILGSTGSGKSTLMHLMDRLYELPEENGRITIGGVDIRDMKASWLRRHIGLVLQEPHLFSRTLADNIAIAEETTDLPRVREAARIASLDETVLEFAKGYDTFVGERGVTLSGGQKQRAAIARMVLQKPKIMVFDDSLSAVDTETDARIRKELKKATGNATVILISHRITTLMQADQILVVNQGKVAELGSHQELLAAGGIYSRICAIQSSGAESREESDSAAGAENRGENEFADGAGKQEGGGDHE